MKSIMTHNLTKIRMAGGALALIALVFSGCAGKGGDASGNKKTGGPAAPQTVVFAVNTTAAVKGQIQDYIALSGDIVAGSTVDVYSDAAGKVAEVYVSVGQRVNKGDRIAAVDPSRPG
ncbi:MAG: efflux RND transporter periplasmic adaptor subunit, partial [Treponema sp.]|nr:efflux RND transporter periplasmic adaptor subunit [Treponema sp.]